MKVISWNVNGARAVAKKSNFTEFLALQPDIFCLQEIKCEIDQIPEPLLSLKGYFAYINPCKTRKGYSGTAIYTKVKPIKVEYGMGIPEFDDEGRTIVAYFDTFVLLNIYFPNGGGGPVRLDYKLRFYDAFLKFILKLRKKGHHVIFCGDVNTAHTTIDLARPKENEKNTGFLPVERAWIDAVIEHDFVDIWREKNTDAKDAYTYWDMKTFARERNVGWRIDYFFIDRTLVSKVKKALIHNTIFGSDHCPIQLDITV